MELSQTHNSSLGVTTYLLQLLHQDKTFSSPLTMHTRRTTQLNDSIFRAQRAADHAAAIAERAADYAHRTAQFAEAHRILVNHINAERQITLPQQHPGYSVDPNPEVNDPLLIEEFTCVICHDVLRDGRVLPCRHSLCDGCLQPILSGDYNVKKACPTCRHSFPIRSRLTVDFPLMPMVFDNILGRLGAKCNACDQPLKVCEFRDHSYVCPVFPVERPSQPQPQQPEQQPVASSFNSPGPLRRRHYADHERSDYIVDNRIVRPRIVIPSATPESSSSTSSGLVARYNPQTNELSITTVAEAAAEPATGAPSATPDDDGFVLSNGGERRQRQQQRQQHHSEFRRLHYALRQHNRTRTRTFSGVQMETDNNNNDSDSTRRQLDFSD